jgi:hypothetical protein
MEFSRCEFGAKPPTVGAISSLFISRTALARGSFRSRAILELRKIRGLQAVRLVNEKKSEILDIHNKSGDIWKDV